MQMQELRGKLIRGKEKGVRTGTFGLDREAIVLRRAPGGEERSTDEVSVRRGEGEVHCATDHLVDFRPVEGIHVTHGQIVLHLDAHKKHAHIQSRVNAMQANQCQRKHRHIHSDMR